MTDIEKVLASLDPKTAARFTNATEHKIHRLATPSFGLNIALKGGLPYGRMVGLWGNRSSGKSTTSLEMIAKAQHDDGKLCAYIDAEKTFDTDWAQRVGVDTDKLILSQSTTITACTKEIVGLQKAGVDVIVADSVSAMLPSVYFTEKGEFKDVEDSKQIGAQARELAIAIPMWVSSNDNTLLIAISQIRNQFGSMHATHIPSGGKAYGHFASVLVKLWSSESEGQAITGKVHNGDLVFDEVIGRKVNWLVEKNKTGPQFQSGTYNFYFHGDFIGIDIIAETLDYAVKHGLIEKSGAGWYTIEGEKFQGKKAVEFLTDNLELVLDYQKKIIYG